MRLTIEQTTTEQGAPAAEMDQLHRWGWSVGLTRLESAPDQERWVVSCIRGDRHIYAEGTVRSEAWALALEKAREADHADNYDQSPAR